MTWHKMFQARKKDLAPISRGLTVNALAILLRIALAIERINIDKQAKAILLCFRTIHLIAGITDARDRINILLVSGKMHPLERLQCLVVITGKTQQLLVVFP